MRAISSRRGTRPERGSGSSTSSTGCCRPSSPLITDIYKTYQGDTAYPSYANPYSRRMQALIYADEAAVFAHQIEQDVVRLETNKLRAHLRMRGGL